MLEAFNPDQDQLIARAKKAYYAAAEREADRVGGTVLQLPDRGWECVEKEGKIAVVFYHGDARPAVRYRLDGSRLRRVSPK